MTVSAKRLSLSYPKARDNLQKYFRVARTDSGTAKCVLPKGAIVTSCTVTQIDNATTAAGAFSVGWAGTANALINAISMPTTSVGQVGLGTAAGSAIVNGTALDSDKVITSTYTVGSSTAGGTAWVQILYFMPGPGELIDD